MRRFLVRPHLLPPGIAPEAVPMLWGKGLRAFADGFVAVLLPVYLLRLGFDAVAVGLVSTATLLGSAVMTLAVGLLGHRLGHRRLLLTASFIMAATGVGFVLSNALWPLLVVAFVGTLNPSGGDVSIFLPLDHAVLSHAVPDNHRTDLFARYSLIGSCCGAIGALCSGLPELAASYGIPQLTALRGMFGLYAIIGLACSPLYDRVRDIGNESSEVRGPLGPSRGMVYRLAALFSLDAFAGGMIVRSLLALWLFQRFGLTAGAAGIFFFASDLLTAVSYLAAVPVARRIGLINTMVFTHLPSSGCLILAALSSSSEIALGLLLVRSLLSQMDVPTRSSYVMAVVTPAERSAAAAVTSVPRSLASAAGPALAGALIAAAPAAPLVLCGGLKIAYDLMLLAGFRQHRPPEER